MVLGGALGPGFGACDARGAAPLCVAGVHNLTSTFVSRGRRGTNSHLPSFCVAGVALMVLGGAGTLPVSFLDGGQARVSRPDNESSSL